MSRPPRSALRASRTSRSQALVEFRSIADAQRVLARFEPEHGAPTESALSLRSLRLRFNFSRRQDLQGPGHAPSLREVSKPGGEGVQQPARAGEAEVARVLSDEAVHDGGADAVCDDSASRGSRPSTEDPVSPTRLGDGKPQRAEEVSPSKVLHLRNIPPDCGELEVGRALAQKGHDPQRVVKIFRKPQALVRMKTIEDVRSPAPPPRRA